ncbi:mandelate racemase/muconate lactonizing enzyme family protein [Lysinibacter cavernae]|uniref:L-alanine-DL-glutamate epimerase-like enolase superfamily enzyme n=1 Tax=Lysinibacter cavernae TaxID=1640652 RepID=A0A7X5TTW5_9MICO|nr:mandelate racemase/muconate lactonizing enzyme family protein [Lysinibacter cavernae]NIH53723.1 L-alanine-DL-glutamate epimerase-like enolase superfamily enzyme [Lysinibacter cavernae]
MKISAIDVFGYDLSYAHGEYVMSGGRAATSQSATAVRITTDDGLEGWGEVVPLGGTYLPTFTGAIRAAIAEIAPALIGADPQNISSLHTIMDGILLGQEATKSAIDIAAWDILGKSAGLPLSTLMGGVLNEDFPLYEAVPLDSPEAMAAFVRARMDAGIRRFQLKVGNLPLEDAARTRAVIETVDDDDDVIVIADSNGGWDVADAVQAAHAMHGLPVYIEQPCRSMADNIIVQRSMSQPLILDECVVTLDDLYAVKYEARAVAINIKLSRVGGLTNAIRIRDAAQSLGLKTSMEDTWGGDLTSAAVSHLAASTQPQSLFNVSFFNDWTNEHIAGYQPRSVNGRGSAPAGPGLGVTVDTSQLTHLATYRAAA